MIMINAENKYLSYKGDSEYAKYLVWSLHDAYLEQGFDMPKMLGDFVFNIEMALQDAGVLDENFAEIKETT